ncbi:SRPBCC domain-containing protein [Photobacterium ganghwense]|uniref:SRPBCC domain-containing protein n=1 Tax=Photobacterium ganghwense TaxID=320778 RepID=UPI001C2DAE82|nr:SRPBCC domain-containing protein [Photobacterium ganghwense]MBV1841523.1 SRPBCC domain-containing protein [Photobacterium ganghwense]
MDITVTTTINRDIKTVWDAWNSPDCIVEWNAASADWHTTQSEVDLSVGGRFRHRMEAKDGSMGFDFEGTFTLISAPERLGYVMDDGRKVAVTFQADGEATTVTETFDAESTHTFEQQRDGWHSILMNFKRFVEGGKA